MQTKLMAATRSIYTACVKQTIKLVTRENLSQISNENPIIWPDYHFPENWKVAFFLFRFSHSLLS